MCKLLTYVGCLLSWLLGGAGLWAQPNTLPLEFTQIQEQQGLAHNLLDAILRDHNGFLWLGTIDGLNRFDGTHFTVFKTSPASRRSLGNSRIHALTEGQNGWIWIGTHRGINYFDPATQQITRIDSVNGRPLGVCYSMLSDRSGNIWFTDTGIGLVRYRVRAGQFDLYPVSSTHSQMLSDHITRNGLLEDPHRNGLWITTRTGLHYLDTATGTFYSYRHNPDALPIFTHHSTSALAMDGPSRLLFSDNDAQQIVVYDPHAQRLVKSIRLVSHRNRDPFPLGTIFVDRNHNFWTSSWSFTLFYIEARTGKATEFFHDETVKTSVAANFFWGAWQHPDGSIWLATMNGLSITNPDRTFYKIHDLKRFDPSINDYFGISSILVDGDTWWLSTPKYLLQYNPSTNQLERYRLPVQEPSNYTPNLPQVIRLPGRNQLIIRFRKELVTFDITRKTFSSFSLPRHLLPLSNERWLSYMDIHGPYLWVFGSFMAGLRYHLQQRTWESIPIPVPRPDFYVTWSAVDQQGHYWLNGYPNGFYRLNTARNTFELHSHRPLPEFYRRCQSFRIDRQQHFWLPTDGFGLVQYTPASDSFRQWGTREGLGLNNSCMGSLDDAGQVWVGFYNRFWVFSPGKKHARSFKILLNESDYQYVNYLTKGPNGHILASLKGYLVEFMPNRYGQPLQPPKLLINSVSPPDTSYLVSQNAGPIRLSVDENTFSVDYSVLTAPQTHKYRVRLDGYDDKWVEVGTKTIASYTKIPGGSYIFRVKATDGDAETAEATIKITVDTEFYNKLWFKLLLLLGVAGLTIAFLNYRTQQTAKLHHLQMQATRLERDKTDIQYLNLINHLNPHFLFNSLTSLNSLIITEPRQASRFLQKLSAIYRYILQNKENESVSVEFELNFVRQYIDLQKSRFEDGLQISLDVPNQYLSRGVVPVTLQNLLENAIKHNTIEDEKPLWIRVYAEDDYLCVENSLQKKKFVETSNKQGLDSLKSLYGYLSDRPVIVIENHQTFIVKVPFLQKKPATIANEIRFAFVKNRRQ